MTPPDPETSFLPRRQGFLLLAVMCAACFFYALGSYPLFDVDEPRYAEAARQMLVRQDWVTPYFNGVVRFDKPPLFYWLAALSYQAFGISEFAARLVSALAATLLVAGVYGLVRAFATTRAALAAALVLASSLQVIALARMAITDMTLSLCLAATLGSAFLGIERHRRWLLAAGVCAGLGLLAKGPVALALPGAIVLAYLLLTRQTRSVLANRWLWLGALAALGVAMPWYMAATQANGQAFLQALYHHNFSRYTGGVAYHPQPWYFYLPVLLIGFLPWSLFLPVTLTGLIQGRCALASAEKRLALFCALWAGITLVFFSVASTKLLTYILPMFPALAVLTALGWPLALTLRRRAMLASAVTLSVLLSVLGGVFLLWPNRLLPKMVDAIASLPREPLAIALVLVLVGGAVLTSLWLLRRHASQALATLALTMGLTTILALQGVVPVVNRATQGAMQAFLARVGPRPLASFEITRPSLTFYARRPIPQIAVGDYATLASLYHQARVQAPDRTLYLITKHSLMHALTPLIPADARMRVVAQTPVYLLLSLSPAGAHTP